MKIDGKVFLISSERCNNALIEFKNDNGKSLVLCPWASYKKYVKTEKTYKHVYITSNKRIKEGMIVTDGNIIGTVSESNGYEVIFSLGDAKVSLSIGSYDFLNENFYEIVATTYQEYIKRGILSINDETIKYFVKSYNEENFPENVEIRYELELSAPEPKEMLNINGIFPKKNNNNEIVIDHHYEPTSEEVIRILKEYWTIKHGEGYENRILLEFIKDRLK
jgi:hypothetical protein